LFGRLRGQARIRARVRPTAPRPKAERQKGRKRAAKPQDEAPAAVAVTDRPKQTETAAAEVVPSDNGGRGRGGGRRTPSEDRSNERGSDVADLSIDEQADVVGQFLTGLAEAFGVDGTGTTIERVEEDTVEVRLDGGDLGLLIGPKGQTLHTVQELARTVVQRRGGGTQEGRIRIDIAGYRQRRREALERFTLQVAESVLSTGTQKALEPMNAADRKVVHDTANGIDCVKTISQGEEPRRRVVLLPDDGS
jgi:spoIIIJ-associated protein